VGPAFPGIHQRPHSSSQPHAAPPSGASALPPAQQTPTTPGNTGKGPHGKHKN